MRKLPWKYVEVEWSDPVSTVKWVESMNPPPPQKCLTRGWLVEDGLDFIVLVGTVSDDDDHWSWSEVLSLPRGCVDSLVELVTAPATPVR